MIAKYVETWTIFVSGKIRVRFKVHNPAKRLKEKQNFSHNYFLCSEKWKIILIWKLFLYPQCVLSCIIHIYIDMVFDM